MSISNFSDAELERELAKRKNLKVKPQKVVSIEENTAFTKLIENVDEMLDEAIQNGYWNEDYNHYIYEEVMTTIYGPGYWPWFNSTKMVR